LLLDYLCVPASQRGQGIGGKLIRAMLEHYAPGTVFIAESEAPTGEEEADRTILRRLRFYDRNGGTLLDYDTAAFGVHFKTICWSKGELPPEEEILQAHREIYLHRFGAENFTKYLQIPLHPGEAVFPLTVWTEEE